MCSITSLTHIKIMMPFVGTGLRVKSMIVTNHLAQLFTIMLLTEDAGPYKMGLSNTSNKNRGFT